MYRIKETQEALQDVTHLAFYMMQKLKNQSAALNFLDEYDQKIRNLETFPFGYRGVSFEYRGYEIRLMPYRSYNIFFIVDIERKEILILRVLKDLQDWQSILLNLDKE